MNPLIFVCDERWSTLPLGLASFAALPPTDQPIMLAAPCSVSFPSCWRSGSPGVRSFRSQAASDAASGALAFLLAASTLGACGGTESGPVTVMVSGDPEEIAAYRAVVAAFNGTEPDVEVRLLPFADRDAMIVRLSTSIAGGSPPDVFLMNYRYYGQFAARGALRPMGPYLSRSTSFTSGSFFETAMAPFRWDGQQMCLPQNVSSLVVYYNEDLFSQAGLEPPPDGWTWDDLVRVARRLTTDADGDGQPDVYGVGVDPEIIRVAPLVWSNGGSLLDDERAPTAFAIDGAGTIAIERFLDLRTRYGVTPTEEEVEAEDLESRFLNGTLAMLFESRRVVPALRTIRDFAWDVVSMPRLSEPVSILHSDAYCMTAASEAKDAAWRFVEFALGEQGQRIAAETGRTVPSLPSVARSQAFLDPRRPPANSEVFLEQIPNLRAVPSIATWPQIEDAVNGLLEEAYYEGATALELTIEIRRTTQGLFEPQPVP
jgi:multiple sugar transport system substrate-binding protein